MFTTKFLHNQGLLENAAYFDEIISLSNDMNNSCQPQIESQLKILELKAKKENFPLMQETARQLKKELIANTLSIQITDKRIASYARYIIVPILYKLGLAETAASLNQQSFSYLFPILDEMIQRKIDSLFGETLACIQKKVKNMFDSQASMISRYYFRSRKSNQSIWKKIPSIAEFMDYDLEQFCHVVDDFIALRWCVMPLNGENRYDAIINGTRILPKTDLYKLRNQQLPQASGFSAEPVMKAYYIIDGVPVEVQILGGKITLYMSAKGYANYKIGFLLPPTPDALTQEDSMARLGYFIFLEETDQQEIFRQVTLNELLELPVIFDSRYIYILEDKPNGQTNRNYKIINGSEPLYRQANVEIIT